MKGGTVLPLDRDKQPPRLMDLMFWVPQISKFLPLRPAGQWCCWGRAAMSQDQGLHGPAFLFDFTHSVGLARPCACRSCDWALVPGRCPGKQVSPADWCSFFPPWMVRELAARVVWTCWFGVTLTCTELRWVLGSRLLLVHCWASGLELNVLVSTILQPLAYGSWRWQGWWQVYFTLCDPHC